MKTRVDCGAPLYFRCHRLAATITPAQCRINRERSVTPPPPPVDFFTELTEWTNPPCRDCAQAPLVDAGAVPLFTVPQVVAGRAMRERSAARLPWQYVFTAAPATDTVFSSHYWVPKWEL